MVKNKFAELFMIVNKDPRLSFLTTYSKRVLTLRILAGHLSSKKSCKMINEYCLYNEAKPFLISKPNDKSYIISIISISDSHIKLIIEHNHINYYLLLKKDDFLDNGN